MTLPNTAEASPVEAPPHLEWQEVAAPVESAAGVRLEAHRVPTFLLVGGTAFVVDAGLLEAAYRFGASLTAAVTIGYAVGLCVHFWLNRWLTFDAHQQMIAPQILRYLVGVAISYGLTLAIVSFGYDAFGITPAFWKAVAIPPTMCFAFCWLSLVVFRRRD